MNVAIRSEPLNLISLCTGGGGLDFGIELALPDARPVVLVEGEAWSVATLVSAMEACLMAPAPVWSDVRTFDGRPWRGLVDGLIGGIPCQPHSLAGRKRGQLDERDLWSPARKIIVRSRPWFVLIENVRGMLSPGDDEIAGAERVWRDLQRLGFQVEVGLFTAEEVGASHERERVFILAVADSNSEHDYRGGSARAGWRPQFTDSDSYVGHADGAGLEGRRHQPDERAGERIAWPDGVELADSRRKRDERRRRAGNVLCAASQGEGQKDQRERNGFAADDGRTDLVNAARDGRGEGWTKPSVLGRTPGADGSGAAMVHANRPERRTDVERGLHTDWHDGGWSQKTSWTGEPSATSFAFPSLYPPGPSDLDSWRRVLAHSPHLEPAVRRMADGVAARLDLTGPHAARIERLRMLGNGVVWLQAAYAFRTLSTRLARRSTGAARLVRMMEIDR